MSKNKLLTIIAVVVFVLLSSPKQVRAQAAGIWIDAGVPASAAGEIAAAGFDSALIHYAPFRTPDEKYVMDHLSSWGPAAKKENLKLFVCIDTGPPLDAVADTATVKYRPAAGDDGYPQQHKPAAADADFWRTAIFPKIDRLAELSSDLSIAGVFLNLEKHVDVSYDAQTFAEFLKTVEPDTDAAAIGARDRKSYLAGKGLDDDFVKYQEDLIFGLMKQYFGELKARSPGFSVNLSSYEYDALHRGVVRAMEEVYGKQATVIYPLIKADDAKNRPAENINWIPSLSVREFFPDELAATASALGLWKSGFIAGDAGSLWMRLAGNNVNSWPLGAADDYFSTLAESKKADAKYTEAAAALVKKLSERVVTIHSGMPKIAIIYSGYMGYMFRDVFDEPLAKAGIPMDKFENSKLDQLIPNINTYDAIIAAPKYAAVNFKKFKPFADDLLQYVKDGGMFYILDGSLPSEVEWLGKVDPELKLSVGEAAGLEQKWLNEDFRMLWFPNRITKFPIDKYHFTEAAPGWRHIARDNEDKPYVVQRIYGRGMMIAQANFAVDENFVINGWEYMLLVKDRYDVEIAPNANPLLKNGHNDVPFLVRTIGAERKLKVRADILSSGLKEQSSEQEITLTREGGARFAVPLEGDEAGFYRITLTFTDEENDVVDRRDLFSFCMPPPYSVETDKNYYTTEKEAEVRITCMKTKGCGEVGVTLNLTNILLPSRATNGYEMSGNTAARPVSVKIPLAGIENGKYFFHAHIEETGGESFGTVSNGVEKLPPGPAVETKLLNFRGGLLEVNGKPFFPLGIYSIPPENQETLAAAGVNAMIYYGNTTQAEADMNTALEGKGIKFGAYPFYPHSRLTDEGAEKMTAELAEKAKNGNLFMWYMADEPDLFGQSPELIRNVYDFVKGVDPYRPQSIVISDNRRYEEYTPAADIFMFDRYPTPVGRQDSVGWHARRSNQAVYGLKPVIAIPQAFSWEVWGGTYKEGAEHRPNYAEMKNSAVQCIAADVKGIIYWAYTASRYDMRKFPKHEENFRNLMKELSGLMDVLMTPNTFVDISVDPDFMGIGWGTKFFNDKLYIFAYNGDPADRDNITFTLPENFAGRKIEVYGEDRTIEMNGRDFSDSFEWYGSHIYIVPMK